MWESTIDGRALHFHLAGINNQNFIMRDEETGSWWQQVSGEAVLGPLKGRRLKLVPHDELSFAIWKREQPQGRVLRPDERVANRYERADWEERMTRAPVVTKSDDATGIAPRALVVGITAGGASKAYPLASLQKQSPVVDEIGGVPVLIVLGDDNRSVRAYERTVDGRALEFFKQTGGASGFVDSETGSAWDFEGRAVSGPLAGRQLKRIEMLEDYWFDWHTYHPDTSAYLIGEQ